MPHRAHAIRGADLNDLTLRLNNLLHDPKLCPAGCVVESMSHFHTPGGPVTAVVVIRS